MTDLRRHPEDRDAPPGWLTWERARDIASSLHTGRAVQVGSVTLRIRQNPTGNLPVIVLETHNSHVDLPSGTMSLAIPANEANDLGHIFHALGDNYCDGPCCADEDQNPKGPQEP